MPATTRVHDGSSVCVGLSDVATPSCVESLHHHSGTRRDATRGTLHRPTGKMRAEPMKRAVDAGTRRAATSAGVFCIHVAERRHDTLPTNSTAPRTCANSSRRHCSPSIRRFVTENPYRKSRTDGRHHATRYRRADRINISRKLMLWRSPRHCVGNTSY